MLLQQVHQSEVALLQHPLEDSAHGPGRTGVVEHSGDRVIDEEVKDGLFEQFETVLGRD